MKLQSSIDGNKISPHEWRGDPHLQIVGGLAAILELPVSGKQKTAIQKMAVLASFWWLRGQDLNLRLQVVSLTFLPACLAYRQTVPSLVFSLRNLVVDLNFTGELISQTLNLQKFVTSRYLLRRNIT